MKKVVFGIVAALLVFGLVLAGCNNDGDGSKDEPKFDGFTLTVNGLPDAGTGKIYGASLLASVNSETPLAIGVPNSGVFYFYHPSAANPQYPDNTPFTTDGTYVLAIALTNLTNPTVPEEIYMYTKGTVIYSSSRKAITLQWSEFAKR